MKKNKRILQKAILSSISLAFLLTGCGENNKNETTENIKEEQANVNETSQQRKAKSKYDFYDYISYEIIGTDGIAVVENLRINELNPDDFDSDKDYIRIKQLLNGSGLSVDKQNNIKNNDIITISVNPAVETTDADKKLINLSSYKFKVQGLKQGEVVDLDKDIDMTYYLFETPGAALNKQKKSEEYEMRIVSIPDAKNSTVSSARLGALRVETTCDEKIIRKGKSVANMSYGYDDNYLIHNNISLTQINKDKGLETCEGNLEGTHVCSSTDSEIIKDIRFAEKPNFNAANKKELQDYILSYFNVRRGIIDPAYDNEINANLESINSVKGIYKVNRDTTSLSHDYHMEMLPYEYAILLEGMNTEEETVYCMVTVGILKNGDFIGMFNNQEIPIKMIQAGYKEKEAIMIPEDAEYSLSSATIM